LRAGRDEVDIEGWLFTEKIIDWHKVEAIAQSDGPGPEDGGSAEAMR